MLLGQFKLMDKKLVDTQWGSTAVAFESFTPEEMGMVCKRLKTMAAKWSEETGHVLFPAYGTLLGIVREEKTISHDFDFDFCLLLGKCNSAEDVVLKYQQAIEKILQSDISLQVSVSSSTQVGLTVQFADNLSFTVDLFAGWFDQNDTFMMSFSIDERFGVVQSDLLPFHGGVLHGDSFSIPKNSEKILGAIYGEKWLTPDPQFSYQGRFQTMSPPPPQHTVFGRVNFFKHHWDSYYARQDNAPEYPSQFAIFCEEFLPERCRLIEFGFGSMRDLRYFSNSGRQVYGVDYSDVAIQKYADGLGKSKQSLGCTKLDVANFVECNAFSRRFAGQFDVVYSRFFLHAIAETSQLNFIRIASSVLGNDGVFLLEARAKGSRYDKQRPWDELELTGDHYRRPIVLAEIVQLLEKVGLIVEYQVEGKGFAVHKGEDPLVCRVVARKTSGDVCLK